MQHLKEQAIVQANTLHIIQFLALSLTSIILPFFIHSQLITGTIINAILILALFMIGIRSALVLCLLPSLIALSSGLLPTILSPIIPFIMVGNIIFVLTVNFFYNLKNNKLLPINSNFLIGIIIGAGLKSLFLFSSINLISKLLFKEELTTKIIQMMSWPQFITAFIGGIIALTILKFINIKNA